MKMNHIAIISTLLLFAKHDRPTGPFIGCDTQKARNTHANARGFELWISFNESINESMLVNPSGRYWPAGLKRRSALAGLRPSAF